MKTSLIFFIVFLLILAVYLAGRSVIKKGKLNAQRERQLRDIRRLTAPIFDDLIEINRELTIENKRLRDENIRTNYTINKLI
ncbi:MAG: hypothetical protein PHS05_02250 [Bacteroidales bacterium]|nr:hypothetical protein [Bacteroidales bacterium]